MGSEKEKSQGFETPGHDKETGRFVPGNPGGAYKKGVGSKRSKAIDEVFASHSHNAVEKLIWLSKRVEARLALLDKAQEEAGVVAPKDALREDEQIFYQTNKTLLEYQYPKLRAIEVSASRFSGVQFVLNAGGDKTASGAAWIEESLEENLAIAERRAAQEAAKEESANE